MRVVSHTPDRLILEHRPRILPLLLGSLVLGVVVQALVSSRPLGASDWIGLVLGITVGVAVTYLTARPSRVEFDASRREVCWEHRGWPGRAHGCCALDDLRGVQASVDPDTDSHGERVVLLTPAGRVPLTRHYSGTEPSARLAATIRAWLESQRR